MTRDMIWARLRALWETTGRSAAVAVRFSAPAWERLRGLWEARKRTPILIEEIAEPEEAPVEEVVTSRRNLASEQLELVDAAIGAHDAEEAMRVLQPMLLEERMGAEVLKRAARVMRLLDEDAFAVLFDAAAASPATGPAIDLASCFLELDDARMALAMAQMALQRGGGDDPMVHALIAECHARQGDHVSVIQTLERFEGDWPEPTLLRRYALSTVLANDGTRWAEISDQLAGDRCAGWIIAAAERTAQYPIDGPAEGWYRRLLFAEYGALLVEPTPAVGLPIRPHVLAKIITAVGDALKRLEAIPDRIAYVGKTGEVFAQWLAQSLDVMAMPLSARITGQSVLAVAADDADLERIVDEPRYAEGPLTIFQVVKSPTYSAVPAPDIIGILGTDVTLPLDPVVAPMAADRLPARLMVGEIERQAGPMLALEAEPDGVLEAWIDERRLLLTAARPTEPTLRAPYVADMPAPQVLPPEPVLNDPAVAEAEAEAEAEAAPSADQEPEPLQALAELDEELEVSSSVEAPPAS